MPVKERVAYIFLLLLLFSLVLFGGCFSKVKELDKISGPTWVTSLTMPLVTRIEEEGYEIRLGDASNAQGEEGLGLTGKSLYSYRLEPEEGSDSFGGRKGWTRLKWNWDRFSILNSIIPVQVRIQSTTLA